MNPYQRTDQTPPPAGVPLRIWWWGEGEITATWDGQRWRDEKGRIVREPVRYWRTIP
jgi:hypothetical protein